MIPRGTILKIPDYFIQAIGKRYLTKTSLYPRPEKKHYRLWALPGDLVRIKETLARQYSILWHPGLNAGIDRDRTIYALCDGVVVITEEKFNPDWDNSLVTNIYTHKEEKMAPLYARYIHVIPKKRISEFKLVDIV